MKMENPIIVHNVILSVNNVTSILALLVEEIDNYHNVYVLMVIMMMKLVIAVNNVKWNVLHVLKQVV
jgi:hypothetical protein